MYNENIVFKLTKGVGQFSIFIKNDGIISGGWPEKRPIKITNVEILNPQKVVRFTFEDGKQIKTICDDADNFSLNDAIYVALAKYISEGNLTGDGVWNLAQELKYYKIAQKIVTKTIKLFFKQEKERIIEQARKEEEKRAAAHRREKKIEYKKRKALRAKTR